MNPAAAFIKANSMLCLLAVGVLAFLGMTACSEAQSPNAVLDQAAAAIELGDTLLAQQHCKSMSRYEHLLPSHLCRQAVIYAKLAEICENPDHTASATKCLSTAYQISPDSVAAFMEKVDFATRARLRMVNDVCKALSDTCGYAISPEEASQYPDTAASI